MTIDELKAQLNAFDGISESSRSDEDSEQARYRKQLKKAELAAEILVRIKNKKKKRIRVAFGCSEVRKTPH